MRHVSVLPEDLQVADQPAVPEALAVVAERTTGVTRRATAVLVAVLVTVLLPLTVVADKAQACGLQQLRV